MLYLIRKIDENSFVEEKNLEIRRQIILGYDCLYQEYQVKRFVSKSAVSPKHLSL